MLGWCCNVYNHDDDRSALELIARARKRSSRASVAAAAQVMMWAFEKKNYPFVYASEVETFLKRIDQQLKTPVIKKKKSGKRKPFSPQSKVM